MPLLKAAFLALALLAPLQAAPDELAPLFADDTLLFAELTKVGELARDWKEHAAAYMPAAKKKELLEQAEKGLREQLAKLPEKLLKDLEKGLPAVGRVALGLRMGAAEPEMLLAASASDPALFPRLVENLRAFSAEERTHAGVPALLIRRMGDVPLGPGGVWLAAAGTRALASSSWEALTAAIDRAAGKGGPDLRGNPTYKAFAPAPADAPGIRACVAGMGRLFDGFSMGMGRRSSAHEMDKVNAVFGLDKLGGFLVEASLKPGQIRSTARLLVGSPCPLYEAWRQPAGPKTLLTFVPADAGVAAHVNARSGAAVLADIRKLIARYEEVETLTAPAAGGRRPRNAREQMDREFEREIGVKPEELFGALGDEACFALVGPHAFAFNESMVSALLFGVKVVDPAGARQVLDKIVAKLGGYETKDVDGTSFYLAPADRGEKPFFALRDRVCLVAGSKEALDLALATSKGQKHVAAGLPAEAAQSSKLVGADLGAMWKALLPRMGNELPAEARGLEFEAKAFVMFEEKENELLLRSSDGGTGLALQAAWLTAPLALFAVRGTMNAAMLGIEELPGVAAPPVVEAPPLPAEQVAARVKALVADLQADDVVKREEADGQLRALGRQAVPAVVAAFKQAADAETRGRLLSLLMDWKAYDAMPEVLAKKIDAFLQGFRRAPAAEDARRMMMMEMGVQWYRHEGMPWTYCMEPSWVNETALKMTPHVDVLQFPAGAKAAAEAAASEATPVEQRRKLAALLAYVDSGKAGDVLVAARDAARDAEVKSYLQIALGWSEDPKCRAAVVDGLKDADVWMRRSSFIAAERSKDRAALARMVELLESPDAETRWNAAYTLKMSTKRQIALNIYGPKAEVDAAVEKAGAWIKSGN